MSSTDLKPPHTVKGILMLSATRVTIPATIFRRSDEAVISRNTSSSAPSSEYRRPHSTGSPASRRSSKWTPFTTRPSFTSRHGMIRLASIGQCLLNLNVAFVESLSDDHTLQPLVIEFRQPANI